MKPKVLIAKVTVYTTENVIGTAVISNTTKRSDSRFLTEILPIAVAKLGLDINNIQQYKFSISLIKE